MPALTLKANLYWWQRIDVAWGFVLLVAVNRWSMEVCFWPNVAVVAAEKPSYMENLIGTSPVDCEENRWSSNKYQAAAWHFRVHTSVSVASLSPVYQNGWPYVWTSILNWYKIQLFFFRTLQWFCLISKLSQTHFDGPWHRKDAGVTYSCLSINVCFGHSYHLTKFRLGVFPHLYVWKDIINNG